MTEQNQNELFDRELIDLLPEEVPEDMSDVVNPWYKPMMQIVFGLGFTSIVLHFFQLDVILPAIGWLLLLLGFRVLRKENKWFRIAWIVSIIGVSVTLFQIVLNSTIWAGWCCRTPVYALIAKMLLLLQPVMDLSLWMGLRSTRRQAGQKPGAGAALALLCWHLLILALGLAFANMDFIFLMIVLLVAYVGILVCLSKIPQSLQLAGFACNAASVWVSDRVLTCTVTGIAVVGVFCGLLFCQKYPMAWTPVSKEQNPQVQQVRKELLAVGFPELVLGDLRDEEVLAMQGTTRVLSGTDVYPVNEGREATWTEDGTKYFGRVYDKKELRVTGIAVLIPGEIEQWQIIHHFRWEEQPKFFGTEAIRLIPTDKNLDDWMGNEDLTGRLLCEKNGETLEAPFFFLGEKEAMHSAFWSDPSTATDTVAAFSLPRSATHQRGYLTYSVSEVRDGCILNSWFDYIHRDSPLLYPNQSALEHQLSGVWDLRNQFPEIQTAVQFYPFREGNVLFGYEDK